MNRRRISLLILVMAVVAIGVGGITLYSLYTTALQQQLMRLTEIAQSRARLIEAIARFDARFSADDVPGGAFAATLQQIKEAHDSFEGFGQTGEFTLARREGDQIRFLLPLRHPPHAPLAASIPFYSERAEPMRRALQGESGTMIARDYRGERVLAAYEPIMELNLGIVAKLDLQEIQTLFLKDKILLGVTTLTLMSLGIALFYWIGSPLVRQLEENEKRLRDVLDAAADGIITLTERGIIDSFNQAAERIFGYRAAEAIGQPVNILLPGPLLRRPLVYLKHYVRLRQRDIRATHKTICQRKNGTTFPVEFTISEIKLNGRRLFTGIVRDITERKQAEEALHRREEELRLTFQNAPMGIFTLAMDNRFLRVNRAFCRMTGYSETELRNMTCLELTHPDDRPASQARIQQVIRGELDHYSIEKRYIRKDHSDLPCVIHGSIVHDAIGHPRMRIIHVEDRTERLKAEKELSELRERLAHVARLSTLGEMTASIAHEINQPLTAISTYAQASRRLIDRNPTDTERLAPTLDKISVQALRAGDVVHRLRSFVKKGESERQLLDCNELVRDVVKLAEVDSHYHRIEIRLELAPNLPPVVADPVQIQQVVLNLIRNGMEAMEHTPVAHKAVTLRTRLYGDGAQQVKVSVTDQGSGLSDEAAAQMFTPFFTTKPAGMGMGLSISRTIITAHGGQLGFTRPPEGGTSFYFTLPAANRGQV